LAFSIEIHNNGLLGDGEILSFCLDIGRTTGNCYFYVVLIETLGVNMHNLSVIVCHFAR